jgi:hypothetical protein
MPATTATLKPAKSKGSTGKKFGCGSGHGGFKPGNTCGKGGRKGLADRIKAARHKAKAGEVDHKELRKMVKSLREHRRGKSGGGGGGADAGPITHEQAKMYHASLRAHHKDVVTESKAGSATHEARQAASRQYAEKGRAARELRRAQEARAAARSSHAENLRASRQMGLHRRTPAEREATGRQIAGSTDAQLATIRQRYQQEYNQSIGSGGLNAGERARMRGVMRQIDAEQKSRVQAAKARAAQEKAEKAREKADKARRKADRTTDRFSMPKHGMSKAKVSFEDAQSRREAMAEAEKMFGRKMTPKQLASIAGAPDDAKVVIAPTRNWRTQEVKGFTVQVDSPNMTATREFKFNAAGKPSIYNAYFVVTGTQGAGLGAKVFGRQIEYATKHNVSEIKVTAARGGSFVGYNTWARFGYKGDIPGGTLSMVRSGSDGLPANLKSATRVEHLMASKEGREWWKRNGETWSGTFDLTKGSDSQKLWRAYLVEKANIRAGVS